MERFTFSGRFLALLIGMSLTGLGLAACGDDDPGTGTDAGLDGSKPDGDLPDGSTPDPAQIRVGHFVTNAPAVDVCVYPAGGGDDDTVLFGDADGIAYKDVTDFLAVPSTLTAKARVYAHADSFACPGVQEQENGSLLELDITGLDAGAGYTVAAIGFLDDPAQNVCGPDFDDDCSKADYDELDAKLLPYGEPLAPEQAGEFALNVFHSIANFGAVNVCVDPDGDGTDEAAVVIAGLEYGNAEGLSTTPLDEAAVVTVVAAVPDATEPGCDGTLLFTLDNKPAADTASTLIAVGQAGQTGDVEPALLEVANVVPELAGS